ncbi:WxL protein peptidoglycan domain-containing protein [Nonomuraea insulae]|uniref:WxL protein peptidoglycan domain-containing protein n=1 Tax=Nonomuraea insulae TaxID=1616787 RepID=A0ABW1CRJ2_9ACTN
MRTTIAQATAVLLLGLAAVWPGPAAAADTSWTVRTASNDFGADRPNYGYTVDPGGRLTDGLVVANPGTTPLHLAVYTADALTTEDGRLDLAAKDTRPAAVGAWVHTERPEVTIPPGGSAEVPFTVTPPEDAAPGEYMGGIVTSLAQAGEADTGRRLGIRIRLRVGGALKPGLSVENPRVRYSGTPNPFGKGEATVTYTIRNTGNAILTARQTVSVSGPFGGPGVRAGQIGDSPQLLPGGAWHVSVPVHGVAPALRLTGTINLVPLLTDAANSISPLTAVESTADTWTVPWTLPLLLVVLCGLVVVSRRFWKQRRVNGQ